MKKINKIGIEFEGEFSDALMGKLEALGCSTKGDGSIRSCRGCDLWAREIVTSPMTLDDERIEKIFDALESAYKKKQYHFNESMGMHIHTSFKDGRRIVLPDSVGYGGFAVRFARSIKKKFPSVYKARGKNHYCKLSVEESEPTAESIASRADSAMSSVLRRAYVDRYYFLNHNAYNAHRTLEVRIWPADSPKRMRAYLEHTMSMFKNALASDEYKTAVTASAELLLSSEYNDRVEKHVYYMTPFNTRGYLNDIYDDEHVDSRYREMVHRGTAVRVTVPETTITE